MAAFGRGQTANERNQKRPAMTLNIYFTAREEAYIANQAAQQGLSAAEIVRPLVDAQLPAVWQETPSHTSGHSRREERGSYRTPQLLDCGRRCCRCRYEAPGRAGIGRVQAQHECQPGGHRRTACLPMIRHILGYTLSRHPQKHSRSVETVRFLPIVCLCPYPTDISAQE